MLLLLLSFLFLLILSAIFSGSEIAYFNKRSKQDDVKKIIPLFNDSKKLLISLLTGNTFINISLASIATLFTISLVDTLGLNQYYLIFLQIFVVSILILIFGEIIPKIIAMRDSEYFAKRTHLIIKLLAKIFYPIALIFYTITNWILVILPINKEKIFDTEEELKILTEISEEQGTLQTKESEIIQSIFEFKDKTVHQIMIPRVDITALPSNSNLDEIMDVIKENQFSKIPIYNKTIDNINGILYAKDLIPYLLGSRPDIRLDKLARPTFFVPENKKLDELLLDFKEKRTNIAIVVDEWGGTAGLLTLEDVVEEVIGEIQDPFDKESSNVKILADGNLIVDGSISIYDLMEETDITFPDSEDRDYDTLGGLILELLGEIPKENDFVIFNDFKYTVKNLTGNRISKVHIDKKYE